MAVQPVAAEAIVPELSAGKPLDEVRRKPPVLRKPNLPERFHLATLNFAIQVRRAAVLERERGTLTLCVPIAMGCGALGYFRAAFEPSWLQLGLWTLIPALLARAVRYRPLWHFIAVAVALAALGATLAKFEVYRACTKILGGEISTRLTGDIMDIDHLANGRVRLLVRVVKTERPALRYQPDIVRLSTAKVAGGFSAGTRITGVARLHPPSGPVLPGGYDFSFESYFDGIGANGYFLTPPQIVASADGWHFFTFLENARNQIAARIRQVIAGPEGEIAAALIVGVRAGIPEAVNDSLRRTGLAHILSISGLHMALVAGIAMGGLRCILALFPAWASGHSTKKIAALGALLLILAYLLVSGGDVAAQRSFMMLAIMLLSIMMDRRALSMRNLAIAAGIVLVVSPHEIVGPSFQMSFAATAALVGAYSIWARSKPAWMIRSAPQRDDPLLSRLLRAAIVLLFGTISTALVAGFATAIFGIWHFQRVSPLSLFANLAVSPIVSIAVMPFSVLAMIAMPFGLERFFLIIVGKGLSVMLAVSDWLSARSPFDAVGLIPGSSVLWLTGALLAVTVPTTRLRWTAPIFAAAGVWTMAHSSLPDILVSEDAQLIAMRGEHSTILINKSQSSGFTLDAWKRALVATEVVPSLQATTVSSDHKNINRRVNRDTDQHTSGDLTQNAWPSRYDIEALLAEVSTRAFTCAKHLCLVEHPTGAIIAVSSNANIPREVCTLADLIVIQSPYWTRPCRQSSATIVNAVSLAQKGIATIRLAPPAPGAKSVIDLGFGIAEPYRPWHTQRAFSRAARGLPPYESSKRKKPSPKAAEVTQQ